MNPQNPSKPVMDVSAPRPSHQPPAAASHPSDTIDVRPAPPTIDAATKTSNPTAPTQPQKMAAVPQAKVPVPEQPRSGAPVGVITVAVLVMMLLSAAAVIIYVTSQTA